MDGQLSPLLAATPGDLENIRARFNPLRWATELAHVRLPKEGELDFGAHPFLRDVYEDVSTEIVVMKGAQLGFSTWAMCRAFWALTTFPMTVIWSFPNRDLVTEYTASRIDPLIKATPYLLERIDDVDSVKIKTFSRAPRGAPYSGTSTIHFSGAAKPTDAVSVDADLLVHDEEDRSNASVIQQYTSRLDHSRYKWRIRLSTPTIPDFGVDRRYRDTDQRKWLVTCPACRAEFELRFPNEPGDSRANIEPHTWAEVEAGYTARFKCHLCGQTLSREDRAGGRWVAKRPGSQGGHGYQISQLAAPWKSAAEILHRTTEFDYVGDFWNLTIGMAWQSGTSAMTRQALEARMGEYGPALTGSGCFLGVDVGKLLDVIVEDYGPDGLPRVVYMDRLEWDPDNNFEELDDLMARFGVTIAVIDGQPETGMATRFARRFNRPGATRVYLAHYTEESARNVTGAVKFEAKDDDPFDRAAPVPVVKAPRDHTIQDVADELLAKITLPKFDGSEVYLAFIDHCRNTKRQPLMREGLEREGEVRKFTWINTGPDHLFHALVYAKLARMAPRPLAAQVVGIVSFNRSVGTSLTDFLQRDEALPRRPVTRLG